MAAVDRCVEVARATRTTGGHQLGRFDRRSTPWQARCSRCGGVVTITTWRSPWGLSAQAVGLDGPCPGSVERPPPGT